MLVLDLPPSPFHEHHLEPNPDRVPRSTGGLPPVASRVGLSEVAHVRLTPELAAERTDIGPFALALREGYRFDYLRFGCSFIPEGNEAFERAWFTVGMRISGPAAGEDAPERGGGPAFMVWSMQPEERFHTEERTTKATLSGELKFLSAELGGERATERRSHLIRAFREGAAGPFWEFTRTPAAEVSGTFTLHMVVRSAGGVAIEGEAGLAVTLRSRRFLLIPVRRSLPAQTTPTFHLPPSEPEGVPRRPT